jgi:hypothetical protein
MAMLAKQAYSCLESLHPPVPVVVRFCGTSPGSANGRALVASIIQHMHFLYDLGDVPVPSSYDEAVSYFHNVMEKYPVVLLIDSLDS